MSVPETYCGRGRVTFAQAHATHERGGTRYTLALEVETLTGEQAEGLKRAFLEWLATLTLGGKS